MEKENKFIKNIAKGIFISLIATIVFLLIFSIILTYSNVKEDIINPVIILIGSSISSMKIGKNGLLNGGIIGGFYILIIYTISSILNWKFGLNLQAIILIIVGIVFGILGGIIGVNKQNK